jgi:uncharacterized membrane protein YbaN (DUF454 family)
MTSNLVKYCLIGLGWFSIVLGVIGIFLPLLPTTPFILLAAWCFSRSSRRFQLWLWNHPQLGEIVKAWDKGEGIPLKVRNRVIGLMWLSLLFSTWLVAQIYVAIALLIIGCCVSYYLMHLPLKQDEPVDGFDEKR